MDNSKNELDYKSIFINYILLITLALFVVIYIIINYDIIKNGDYYKGDFTKTILLTGIVILLLYLFATWDDEEANFDNQVDNIGIEQNINNNVDSQIPKFSIGDVNKLINQSAGQRTQPVMQTVMQPVSQPIANIVVQPVAQNIVPIVPTIPNNILQRQSIGQSVVQPVGQTIGQIVTHTIPQPQIISQPILNAQSMGLNDLSIRDKTGNYSINNINPNPSNPVNTFGNSSMLSRGGSTISNLAQIRHIEKLENQNIFVSQKNSLRYGIKF
jgi:hypothetical protein